MSKRQLHSWTKQRADMEREQDAYHRYAISYSAKYKPVALSYGHITFTAFARDPKDMIDIEGVKRSNNRYLNALAKSYPILFKETALFELSQRSIHTASGIILSRAYSSPSLRAEANSFFRTAVNEFLNVKLATPIKDIILFVALNIAKGGNYPTFVEERFSKTTLGTRFSSKFTSLPLKFLYLPSSQALQSYMGLEYSEGGEFSAKDGVLSVVKNEHGKGFLAHELTHVAMLIMFNNKYNPYPFTKSVSNTRENAFKKAVQDTFNIIKKDLMEAMEDIVGYKMPIDFTSLKTVFSSPNLPDDFMFGLEGMLDKKFATKEKLLIKNILLMPLEHYAQLSILDGEIIAPFVQFFFEYEVTGIDTEFVGKFLKPIKDFWQSYIVPEVNLLLVDHCKHKILSEASDASKTTDTQSFQFFVQEILDLCPTLMGKHELHDEL